MVEFNELRIYDNKLIIDVNVRTESYYDNVYLDTIIIDNQNTYNANGPSNTPVYFYTVPDVENPITHQNIGQKVCRLELDVTDGINLSDLMFVYVITKGVPASNTPCSMDNDTTLRAVLDMSPIYNKAMYYIGNYANACNSGNACDVPKDFIDFILHLKGLEYSVLTCNYMKAIDYYNEFYRNVTYKNGGGCCCGHH